MNENVCFSFWKICATEQLPVKSGAVGLKRLHWQPQGYIDLLCFLFHQINQGKTHKLLLFNAFIFEIASKVEFVFCGSV